MKIPLVCGVSRSRGTKAGALFGAWEARPAHGPAGTHLRALVTPEALESLKLAPGSEVMAIIEATSIAYLGSG